MDNEHSEPEKAESAGAGAEKRMKPKPGLINVSCPISHKPMHHFPVLYFL